MVPRTGSDNKLLPAISGLEVEGTLAPGCRGDIGRPSGAEDGSTLSNPPPGRSIYSAWHTTHS